MMCIFSIGRAPDLLVGLLLLVLLPFVLASDRSIKDNMQHKFLVGMTTSVHQQITKDACAEIGAEDWGWTMGADSLGNTDMVLRRIRAKIDVADMPIFNSAPISIHFDNIVFEEGGYPERYDTIEELNTQWADFLASYEALTDAEEDDLDVFYDASSVFVRSLGFILHSLQDLYAHSNYVERALEENEELGVEDIGYVEDVGPDPDNLEEPFSYYYEEGLYTGTYREDPREDIPHHDEMCKDGPEFARGPQRIPDTNEHTLFDYARAAAVAHSIAFLTFVNNYIDEEKCELLFENLQKGLNHRR